MGRMMSFLLVAWLLAAPVLWADDPPPKPWSATFGISYLGTGGNTDNQSFGTDFAFKRLPRPWGLEGGFGYLVGSQHGDKTAERLHGALKGLRTLRDRWEWFLSGSWGRDRFSGYDSRLALATGVVFKAMATKKNELLFDVGFGWNHDRFLNGNDASYLGGILQLRFTHHWTPSAKFSQRLLFVPNFSEAAAWHGESESALVAALTSKLALKGSFLLRTNARPPAGFKKTDTTTALSLVCQL